MKKTMSVMFVMIMAFALVSVSEAGAGSMYDDNAVLLSGAHNTIIYVSATDADLAGSAAEWGRFPCPSGPAFTDYTDAIEVPCAPNPPQMPDVTGSW